MSSELDKAIGEAWKYHYSGDHDMAIMKFNELTQQHPQHVDALYGLGLSQKSTGDAQAAKATFIRLQDILKDKLADDDDVRARMVYRMVKQQLELIG